MVRRGGRLPELTIIIAHAGRACWYDRVAARARLHHNVHLDISGRPPARLPRSCPDLYRLADTLLFGFEWPAIPTEIGEHVATLRSLGLSEVADRGSLAKRPRDCSNCPRRPSENRHAPPREGYLGG